MNAWAISFGSAWGSAWGVTPIPPVVVTATRGGISEKKRERPISDDIRAAIAELEHVTTRTTAALNAPTTVFAPANDALIDAIDGGRELMAYAKSVVQRTQLQIAISRAKDARDQLQAREEAVKAIKKARLRRAAAFLSVFLS